MSAKIKEMSKRILETRAEYGQVVDDMNALNEKAALENRDFTEDENKQFAELSTRAKSLNDSADRQENIYFHLTGTKLSERNTEINLDDVLENDNGGDGTVKEIKQLQKRAYEVFEDWMSYGGQARKDEYASIALELRDATPPTFDGQNMTSNTEGGYLAPHEKLHHELIGLLNKKNIIRSHAQILSLQGTDKLTIPAIADDGGDASWVAENEASPEGKMTFKQMSITLNRLSKTIPISRHLIKNSSFNITNIIAENLSTSMANSMEVAYLNGDGVGKPLGIFSNASGGIPTSRDINVGTASDLIDYDGLIDAESMLHETDKQNAS